MNLKFYVCLLVLVLSASLPVSAQWSSATLSQPRSEIIATTAGNKALFGGGWFFDTKLYRYYDVGTVDIYNATTDQWTSTYRISMEKSGMATTSLGNLAFFAGGFEGASYYNTVDIYNALTDKWAVAQLSIARIGIGAASAGDKVLFAGGVTQGYYCNCLQKFNTVDVYNVTTNQWSVTQLPRISGAMLATAVGNKLVFTGNETGNGLVDIYDVTTGQWTAATIPQSQVAQAVVSVGNKVLFVVGSASQVYIYNVDTDQWTTGGSLSQARRVISTTRLGSKVFFAGGVISPNNAKSNVLDIYDTATNQWEATQLPQLSGAVASTPINNKVLFTGDGTNNVDVYTVDSVLPVNLIAFTGAWSENIGTQLAWQTSLEKDNDHFEIQRSADAKSFESIGRVQGKGTTEDRTEYSFVDTDMPDGISYYRLKQVDFDGSAHFSNIISVSRLTDKQPAQLTTWFTPGTDLLNLRLSTSVTISQLTVHDPGGRRLITQTGSQSFTDISTLPAGIYIVSVVTADGQHLRSRFVKP